MQAHCPRANQIIEETMHSKEIQDEERQNHVRINIVKPKVINYVSQASPASPSVPWAYKKIYCISSICIEK